MKFDLYTFLGTIGLVQAMTLGVLLIIVNKPKHKSTLSLGLLLIFFSLGTIPRILEALGAFAPFPELYLLPFDLFWLYFPLYHLHLQYTGFISKEEKKPWLLYPGMVAFALQSLVYILPYKSKVLFSGSALYRAFQIIELVFGLGVGIYTFYALRREKQEISRRFPLMATSQYTWAGRYLVYAVVGFAVYAVLIRTAPENLLAQTYFIVFDLVFIYWTAFYGFQQNQMPPSMAFGEKPEFTNVYPTFETLAPPSKKGHIELMDKIHEYLTRTERYTDTELTVVDLAGKLGSHPKQISSAINKVQHQNFNAYINLLRIRKAEDLLKNKALDRLSIEGIGKEVGFHSKSAFYSAFKKKTGTTPFKYKALR